MLLRALIKNLRPPRFGAPKASLRSGGLRLPEGSEQVKAESRGRALMLAVTWDRIDIGNELLLSMSADMTFTYGHHVALMFILEKQRVEVRPTTPQAAPPTMQRAASPSGPPTCMSTCSAPIPVTHSIPTAMCDHSCSN